MPLLLLLLAAGCGDTEAELVLPEVMAVLSADDAGLFAWVADEAVLTTATGQAGQPAVLQWRVQGGSWAAVEGPAGQGVAPDTRYWLPAAGLGGDPSQVELRVAIGADGGATAAPIHVAAYLSIELTDPPLLARDTLAPTLTASLAPLEHLGGALELQVDLDTAQGVQSGFIDRTCPEGSSLQDCWLPSASPWVVPDLSAELVLPSVTATHALPAWLSFTARIYLDAVGTDGAPTRGLVAMDDTEPVLSVGRKLYWGDLHAHSNLSHDGCEEWEEDCSMRGDYAAQDFFQNARAAGLDFVAITDHAEWGMYYPDGLGAAGVDIWEEQKRLAAAADGPELVTLVGYEYTNYREKPTNVAAGYEGGHKTVIFEQLDVHSDFRIGAERDDKVVKKGDGSAYQRTTGEVTNDPTELTALLDAAAKVHGSTRVLTYFHHSALDNPQGVDFRQDFNRPDARYEPVLEMNSEHGSSECLDVTAEYCDFGYQEEIVRLDYGTIQYALSEGYQVGFVSGTDCHDSRPGSTEDGPGYHGSPNGADSVILQQFADGGVTGAWVAGPLDRVGLFDAIFERATVSSSGPRIIARAIGVDDQGRPWLPGSLIPADASTLTVQGRIDGNGSRVDRVQIVDRWGQMIADSEGAVFSHTITLEPGGAWYVRIILTDVSASTPDTGGTGGTETGGTGTGGTETGGTSGTDTGGVVVTETPQRAWLSPYFAAEPE